MLFQRKIQHIVCISQSFCYQHPFFSKQAASHKQTHEQQIKKNGDFCCQTANRANRVVFVLGSCGNKSTVTYCVCVICSSGAFDTFVLISVANANHLFDKLTLHATILNSIYD